MKSSSEMPAFIRLVLSLVIFVLVLAAAMGMLVGLSINAFAGSVNDVELTPLAASNVQGLEVQKIEQDTIEVPAAAGLVDLLRSTLLMVNNGNQTGDYSQLYANLTPPVQKNVDVDRLSQALAGFRKEKIDMSAIAIVNPEFTKEPELDADGVLNISGYFPTEPRMVIFSIGYRKLNDKWLVEAIDLNTPSQDAKQKSLPTKALKENIETDRYIEPPTTIRW